MNALLLLPAALNPDGTVSAGEAVLFWIVAPLAVLGALALLFSRRAVYAAVAMIFVMIGLASLYVVQEATFLGVVQVVVYTGAIMMMFLFVLMLVGVDASESLIETIRGHRWLAGLFGLGLVSGLGGIVLAAATGSPQGLEGANADSNPVGVARVLFAGYPFAMQLTGALLIIAAVSAITMTHRERLHAPVTQRAVADAKLAAWASRGARISGLPAPGVYATHNGADIPALAANGEPVAASVPRVLRVRGQQLDVDAVAPDVVTLRDRPTPQSGLPNMPGEPAPQLTKGEEG